jgi:hypothetical protein
LISKWQIAQLQVQTSTAHSRRGSVRSRPLPHQQTGTEKEQVA